MSDSNSILQERYFYGNVFNKPITMCLLNFLVRERNAGRWAWNESNVLCIVAAQRRLNSTFGRDFTTAIIHKRVRLLQNRWRTFNYLLGLSGVQWDRVTNRISMPTGLYEAIYSGNRLVAAYQYEGDPQYDLLEHLFNDPGVEAEFLPAMDEDDVEPENEADVHSDDD